MFYYRITKRTAAVPKVETDTYEQVGSRAQIGLRAQELMASGLYGKVCIEAVSQADYVRATRGGE